MISLESIGKENVLSVILHISAIKNTLITSTTSIHTNRFNKRIF